MNCFEKLTAGCVCRNCGFDNDTIRDALYLPLKAVLINRYVVGNIISYESDAVTYIGYDTERMAVVTVREFLPKNITNRLEGNYDVHVRERYKKNYLKYKDSFIKLWKTLKELNSLSAVIPVLDVFEANETAYAVCEKMDTVTLRDFLIRNTDNNILWDKARLMFMPILTTLENLHKRGIIHGAINPDNLVLCRDGKVRLAGFCISECCEAAGELEFNPVPGYSALEQYQNAHKLCPATDIYAFSACIYRALVGTNPPEAPEREINDKLMIPNSIAEKIPAHVIRALGGGLQIYPENRIQSIEDFRELLSAAPSVVAQAVAAAAPIKERPRNPVEDDEDDEFEEHSSKNKFFANKRNVIIVGIIAAVVLIAAIAALIGFSGGGGAGNETTLPSSSTVTVPNFCSAGYFEEDISNTASWNSQFNITFTYEFSSKFEKGVVFKQSVAPKTEVSRGSDIVLTVSKGVEMVDVPDVGGLSRTEAVSQLEKAGFKVKTVTVYNDGSGTYDNVKSNGGIAPQEGSTVPKGEEVIIQVYGRVVTEPETEPSTQPEANQPSATQ